jgi:hypothetical protein
MILAIKTPPGGINAHSKVELEVYQSKIKPIRISSLTHLPGCPIQAKNIHHVPLPGDRWYAIDASTGHILHPLGE